MANLMDDYSRLVEVLQVDAIEYDQPDPYARLVWRDGYWKIGRASCRERV